MSLTKSLSCVEVLPGSWAAQRGLQARILWALGLGLRFRVSVGGSKTEAHISATEIWVSKWLLTYPCEVCQAQQFRILHRKPRLESLETSRTKRGRRLRVRYSARDSFNKILCTCHVPSLTWPAICFWFRCLFARR